MKKNVVISWSSGKDSTLTLLRILENPNYKVVGLYTTFVKDEVPFQATPIEVVEMQASLIGLPLIKIELLAVFPSNEVYQSLVVNGIKNSGLNIEAVAFGDMFCNGIADYRRSYIEPAGLECVFPLLGESSSELANEIIERGIRTTVTTTDGQALSKEWCGLEYSHEFIQSLPKGVDPCGEDGEFHTLVTSAPCFDGCIKLTLEEIETGDRFSHQRYQATALPNSN